MIIKQYCDWFYAHRFDNPSEIDQFFERHNEPKPKQEEEDKLNRLTSIKQNESTISKPQKTESTRPR